ncbi:MAG: hypothetical protein IJT66_04820 [Clostridia bacterium]|nr:hypothetical protein [Clostridia bacterium]
MGLFDTLKGLATDAARQAARQAGQATQTAVNRTAQNAANAAKTTRESIAFSALPQSLAEMQALPEAALQTPFQTAALTVCALCAYTKDTAAGAEMLNWLRGPRPLSPYDQQFLRDRFMDGKQYIPFSYFAGATPENEYTPSAPLTLTIEAGPYAYQEENYARLDLRSGGADTARQIVLRKKGDGTWLLWDQFLLTEIRQPKSQDPWA